MSLVRPLEVIPGIHQIQAVGAKVTVLTGEDGAILVDAGGRGSFGLLSAGLKVTGTSLERVRLIVLTHYHPDHAGGLGRLVKATGAQVAVHRREAGIIMGEEPPPTPFRSDFLTGATEPFLPLLYDRPVAVDFLLNDGDMLPFAQDVRVIHTPGHTEGSICLYVAPQKLLIVGDALQYRFHRLGLPAPLVTRDPEQAKASLKKLLSLDFEIICFSHFPPLRHNARGALNRLVQETVP